MLPICERLFDHAATTRTDLRRAPRIDFHNLASSLFRFDAKPMKEVTPRGVVHRLCQHARGQSSDVQIFNVDPVVFGYQRAGQQNRPLAPPGRYPCVFLAQQPNGSAPPSTPALSPRDSPLSSRDLSGLVAAHSLPRHIVAIARGDERREPEVDTDLQASGGEKV